jgi:hypothetical protein
MWIFAVWVGLSLLAAAQAARKGWPHRPVFALAIFLSPLIGLALALLLPSRVEANLVAQGVLMPCPACAGLIRAEAACCKHCAHLLATERVIYATPKVRVTNRGLWVVDANLARRMRTSPASHWS